MILCCLSVYRIVGNFRQTNISFTTFKMDLIFVMHVPYKNPCKNILHRLKFGTVKKFFMQKRQQSVTIHREMATFSTSIRFPRTCIYKTFGKPSIRGKIGSPWGPHKHSNLVGYDYSQVPRQTNIPFTTFRMDLIFVIHVPYKNSCKTFCIT